MLPVAPMGSLDVLLAPAALAPKPHDQPPRGSLSVRKVGHLCSPKTLFPIRDKSLIGLLGGRRAASEVFRQAWLGTRPLAGAACLGIQERRWPARVGPGVGVGGITIRSRAVENRPTRATDQEISRATSVAPGSGVGRIEAERAARCDGPIG